MPQRHPEFKIISFNTDDFKSIISIIDDRFNSTHTSIVIGSITVSGGKLILPYKVDTFFSSTPIFILLGILLLFPDVNNSPTRVNSLSIKGKKAVLIPYTPVVELKSESTYLEVHAYRVYRRISRFSPRLIKGTIAMEVFNQVDTTLSPFLPRELTGEVLGYLGYPSNDKHHPVLDSMYPTDGKTGDGCCYLLTTFRGERKNFLKGCLPLDQINLPFPDFPPSHLECSVSLVIIRFHYGKIELLHSSCDTFTVLPPKTYITPAVKKRVKSLLHYTAYFFTLALIRLEQKKGIL